MSSDVFYRQYRPNQLEKVVGQPNITGLLTAQIESGFMHHAYLLCGRYGCGKTTIARIIAKIANCTNRAEGSTVTCNKCESCIGITNGTCADVQEFDGGSHGHKDEICEIIKMSSYSPVHANKRVFIINEFQELSAHAKTALLTATEEPPETSLFIFTTTDYPKVPPALASRCHRFFFRPVSESAIADYLLSLCKHREIQYESSAFLRIARVSDGSIRTALGELQALEIAGAGSITLANCEKFLGLMGREAIYDLFAAIGDRNAGMALDIVESIMDTSPDTGRLLGEMSQILSAVILIGCNSSVEPSVTPDERKRVEAIAAQINSDRIAEMSDMISDSAQNLVVNINQRLVMESIVVKMCKTGNI